MKIAELNGIPYPAKMKIGSWLVVGPPGSGKSRLIETIKGYPGEVGIDISEEKWWSVEPLSHRPREVHFAMPFVGYENTASVYDEQWKTVESYPELDVKRIQIPTKKKFILAPNWLARFVFDFILPPPTWLCKSRELRLAEEVAAEEIHLIDRELNQAWITWQVHTHWKLAWHFHTCGLQVMLRPFNTARPYSFPVLKKVLQKKPQASEKEADPNMDWTKVKYVKLWFDEASPDGWKIRKK